MAREGADLGEALDELRSTTEWAAGRTPIFRVAGRPSGCLWWRLRAPTRAVRMGPA